MNSAPIKVLVDLSYAALGYCGISQESRLFLKSLWENADIEPTGLVFSRCDAVLGHRFCPRGRFDARIENQAIFLQTLVDGPPRATRLDNWRCFADRVYRRFFSRHVATDQ